MSKNFKGFHKPDVAVDVAVTVAVVVIVVVVVLATVVVVVVVVDVVIGVVVLVVEYIGVPGHSNNVQTPASVDSPKHCWLPPKSGSLQARALSQDPSPQEALHSDQGPHSCHSESTAARKFTNE